MKKNNIAIIGTSAGDESKAAITHHFSPNFEYVVRFGGSLNAGHTLYHKGQKIIRRMVPSVDFSHSHTKAFLGSGMVIDLNFLLEESQSIDNMFPGAAKRIIVDPEAFVILPQHIEEDKENVKKWGSTGKGVGPAYRDKIDRKGIRVESFIKDNAEIIQTLSKLGVQFKYSLELKQSFEISNTIFEGAQAMLLDISHGTYPYVTCGEAGLAGIINSGFAFAMPAKVYGISKCYTTRVGEGPFPTELHGEAATKLRERGGEYGAVTKRPRRVGWLDLPALEYACEKAGITHLVVSKLDILNGMKRIPVCMNYDKDLVSSKDFFTAKPNLKEIPGWVDAHQVEQILPFIREIEQFTHRTVELMSCGIEPKDIIKL